MLLKKQLSQSFTNVEKWFLQIHVLHAVVEPEEWRRNRARFRFMSAASGCYLNFIMVVFIVMNTMCLLL